MWGLTATILMDAARLALGRQPTFQVLRVGMFLARGTHIPSREAPVLEPRRRPRASGSSPLPLARALSSVGRSSPSIRRPPYTVLAYGPGPASPSLDDARHL